MKLRLVIVAALALTFAPAAAGHGGGSNGFKSTVTAVRPALVGVTIGVRGGDDRLRLENRSDETIVVRGYGGEPYLRFGPDGVYENENSPAPYLNKDRFARAEVPKSANDKAKPSWRKVSDGTVFEWHDHRIHWMSPIPPRPIRENPNEKRHVFNWQVPATGNGKPFVIAGTLDYSPPNDGGVSPVFIAALSAALLVTLGGLYLLRRRVGRR
ncbi:MAG TPA: hypothetical protein VFL41_09200 [Gaiellaceae bacterium]|nr:hypothetical protein [Gaiellaceae bacterium]